MLGGSEAAYESRPAYAGWRRGGIQRRPMVGRRLGSGCLAQQMTARVSELAMYIEIEVAYRELGD